MHPLIEENREAILSLARKRGVSNVRLFGSMARSDSTPSSDIDFLVKLEPGRSGFELGGLLMDLQDLLGRRVDVVTETALHPRLREKVLAQAIPL